MAIVEENSLRFLSFAQARESTMANTFCCSPSMQDAGHSAGLSCHSVALAIEKYINI